MIWVVGGTSNAKEICEHLASEGHRVLVSVTTDYGRQLSEFPGIEVVQGKLSREEMEHLIQTHGVRLVVDASHPFAAEVSAGAMQAAKNTEVPYLRFERANTRFENATYVDGYEQAVAYLEEKPGNILLTTGSKFVAKFIPLGAERLFARVLSTSDSVALCEQAGLKPVNVIAMCGVGSVALNLAFLKEFDIRFLITKESGVEGGLQEKIEAANQVNAEVIIIQRPAINYPEVYSDYDLLMDRIKTI
ncbi:precorrin-6x reductase [Paludibacter propionicigenes WB4]|uniref:Precorrin-6x reductase n=1 Tax=Paludibacter propionicigenes (strain DSM 17365 / JCM 13257 / WB4) TaxID=694427 RepID=E4T7L1_PALPW|nr:precorrin-6A reductase [Paludibacter propionicigenes]ADQ80705.1 precorrin-6x reductase [Paludibacter propionicigenes WB4]